MKFNLKLEGETALLFNNLLDNLYADYLVKRSELKILFQKALREVEVLNIVADKLSIELLTRKVNCKKKTKSSCASVILEAQTISFEK